MTLDKHFCVALLLGMVLPTPSVRAQAEEYRFSLDFGYRWKTATLGSQDLYRSQLDYGEGPKLFSGDLSVSRQNRFFDHLEVRFNSWGGEPYNSARVRSFKRGVYELHFDYLNVQYFNAIPFFANPLLEKGDLRSQHKYDISQRLVRFSLRLRPGKRISPFFSYQRVTRQGPVRTTLSADGDEFLLDAATDNHSDDLRAGVEFRIPRFTLRLEQGFRWFRDETRYRASGFQEGNSTRSIFGREITLDQYNGRNDVQVSIPFSTAAAVFEPDDSLSLSARISYGIADLDSDFSESSRGTFFSFPPLAIFYGGGERQAGGEARRPSLFGDFSAAWRASPRFRLIERFQLRRFHVSGSVLDDLTFDQVEPLLGSQPDPLRSSSFLARFLSMDIDIQEFQGVFYPISRLQLRAGHRFEHKKVRSNGARFTWDQNVFTAGAAYDFSRANRISLEYELGRTDRPLL
ncbi:MAG: hypothetical protein ACE5JX_11675, partial [Acidobacteriota bacterium]